jgi:hypothetical protein
MLVVLTLLLLLLQDLGKTDKKEDSKQQYLLLQVSRTTWTCCLWTFVKAAQQPHDRPLRLTGSITDPIGMLHA